MPDRFASHAASLDAPADTAFSITPSDAADLAETTRALYVGTSGTVVVTMAAGGDVTLANVPAGTILPLRVRRVRATGTTAAALVGLV